MAKRVFLDANILFSAAKSDGAVRALLGLLLDRRHECCADAYVVAAARRNLVNKGQTLFRSWTLCSAICKSPRPWQALPTRANWNGCRPKTDLCWPQPFACGAMCSLPLTISTSAAGTGSSLAAS